MTEIKERLIGMNTQNHDASHFDTNILGEKHVTDSKKVEASTSYAVLAFTFLGPPLGALLFLVFITITTVLEQVVASESRQQILSSIVDKFEFFIFACIGSYFVGGLPAIMAGIAFAFWFKAQSSKPPFWKAGLVGALQGGICTFVFLLLMRYFEFTVDWRFVIKLSGLGALAGLCCALFVNMTTLPNQSKGAALSEDCYTQ